MGQIKLTTGKLTVEGVPFYELPANEEITLELLDAIVSEEPGSEMFLGELAHRMSPDSKLRLRQACKKCGCDKIWRSYCLLAAKWAPVVNDDNVWHLEDFDTVYEAEINAWWAQTIIVTTTNIRFVRTARGLFTFPEFQHVYGVSILDHLENYREHRANELEAVIRNIRAELVKRRVRMVDDDGNHEVKEVAVLASLDSSEWRLPAGFHLLEVEE